MRLCGAFVMLLLAPAGVVLSATTLDVYFLDVGHGDAILIEQGPVEWLIDTGYKKAWEGTVGDCSDLFGIPVFKPLEHFILTHDHEDHYSALGQLLCPCWIQTLYSTESRSAIERLLDEVQTPCAGLCTTASTSTLSPCDATAVLGGVGLNWVVLYPSLEDLLACKDVNDTSLVLLLTFGKVSFLFPGDLQTAPSSMANWGVPSGTVILKAPHHGSSRSALQALMDHFHPDLVVFSTEDTVPALACDVVTAGVSFLSTSTSGCIHVCTDGESVWITTATLSGGGAFCPCPSPQ